MFFFNINIVVCLYFVSYRVFLKDFALTRAVHLYFRRREAEINIVNQDAGERLVKLRNDVSSSRKIIAMDSPAVATKDNKLFKGVVAGGGTMVLSSSMVFYMFKL